MYKRGISCHFHVLNNVQSNSWNLTSLYFDAILLFCFACFQTQLRRDILYNRVLLFKSMFCSGLLSLSHSSQIYFNKFKCSNIARKIFIKKRSTGPICSLSEIGSLSILSSDSQRSIGSRTPCPLLATPLHPTQSRYSNNQLISLRRLF